MRRRHDVGVAEDFALFTHDKRGPLEREKSRDVRIRAVLALNHVVTGSLKTRGESDSL